MIKKEDFDREGNANDSGISLDHPDTADVSLNTIGIVISIPQGIVG